MKSRRIFVRGPAPMGALSVLALVVCCGSAAAVPAIDVIYSRAATSPTSNVPGAVDTTGAAVSTKWNSMLEFWMSPDGTKWILRGSTTQPTAESDSILVLGSGLSGSMVLQEGRPFPGAVGNEVVDFFTSSEAYPFNANNDWAFALRAKGGVASVFQKIVRFNAAGVGVLRYQMGDAYTGMTDNPVGNAGNETIGNSASSIHLRNDGVIGWHDPNPGNLSSARYPVSAYDAVRYLQSNADTVTKIDNSGTIGLSSISSTGTISVFLTSPDGTRKVIRGKADVDNNLSSLSDPDCVVVDGAIKAQVSQTLPGDSSILVSALNQTFVAANNDWYLRGTTSTGAWAVKNGTVIAKTGALIGAGPETWGSATFSTISGNSNGDWLLIGKINGAAVENDDVLVVNGVIKLREGDPVSVDIDGDGNPDTAYIGRGNNTLTSFVANNCAGLAPDGTVYVLANLRTTATSGADLASSGTPTALIRISTPVVVPGVCCRGATCTTTFTSAGDCTNSLTAGALAGAVFVTTSPTCNASGNTVTPCCHADYNKINSLSVQDIFDFLNDWLAGRPYAKIGGNGSAASLAVQDIFDFLNAWFSGC